MARPMSGPGWRVSTTGARPVYVNRYDFSQPTGERAFVSSRVVDRTTGRAGWAKKGFWIAATDLFLTKAEAQAEHRRRRDTKREEG